MRKIGIKKAWISTLAIIPAAAMLMSGNATKSMADIPVPATKPVILASFPGHINDQYQRAENEEKKLPVLVLPAVKPLEETSKEQLSEDHISHEILSNSAIPLPAKKPFKVLGESLENADAELYRDIFMLQAEANWAQADKLITRLNDPRLMGHVLYQRYMHPTAYVTKFEELDSWLNAYNDHPGAEKIYNLALAKMPADHKSTLQKPNRQSHIGGFLHELKERGRQYKTSKQRSALQNQEIQKLQSKIKHAVSKGEPTKALKSLMENQAAQHLDSAEYDKLLAHIARGYLNAEKITLAYDNASLAVNRSGDVVPDAAWVAGLSAWRMGRYDESAKYFGVAAHSQYSSTWLRSAGAYWASRAYEKSGNDKEHIAFLSLASSYPRTFYGLIAAEKLGENLDFDWRMPTYTDEIHEMLGRYDEIKRARKLIKAGQYHLAEAELWMISAQTPKMQNALLAFAHHNALPSYAMRLASSVTDNEGTLFDAALYPEMSWSPQSGYDVDRALIHAIIRQESKFDTAVSNASGATGLMQIMPRTASYIDSKTNYKSEKGRHILKNPQRNLDLGQRYIKNLMGQHGINNDLFALMIAYNAGPGNLRKWQKQFGHLSEDPLLFIESIPSAETRAFIERVSANYWLYRMRFEQGTPSLAQIANDQPARYVRLDDVQDENKQASRILKSESDIDA